MEQLLFVNRLWQFTFFFVFVSIIKVLEAFFRRALKWEKREEAGVNLTSEEEGVFTFHSGSEVNTEIGILLEGRSLELPFQKIQAAAMSYKAFNLVIIQLEKVRDKLIEALLMFPILITFWALTEIPCGFLFVIYWLFLDFKPITTISHILFLYANQ